MFDTGSDGLYGNGIDMINEKQKIRKIVYILFLAVLVL